MVVEAALPKRLADVIEGPVFDDDAGILIEAVKFIEDSIILTFSIRFYDNTPAQIWQLTVGDVKAEKLMRRWSQSLALYSKHLLLLEYTDMHTELYFKGNTEQSNDLFADIFNAIAKLSDSKEDILPFLFTPESINRLCKQEHGLFARGPRTILEIYQGCLNKYNIHSYFIAEYKPSINDQNLNLFKLGESYIIGQSFLFEQLL